MNVKNYYVSDLNIVLDMYVKGLSLSNIDYLIVKNYDYIEVHFLNNIYRFFGTYKEKNINDISILFEEGEDLIMDNKFIYASLKDIKFCSENLNSKNRGGYKVLKKNDYKKRPNSKKKK